MATALLLCAPAWYQVWGGWTATHLDVGTGGRRAGVPAGKQLQGALPSRRPFPPAPHCTTPPLRSHPCTPWHRLSCTAWGQGTKDDTFGVHLSQGPLGSASSRPARVAHIEAEARWGTLWRGQSICPSLGNQRERGLCDPRRRGNVLPSLTLPTLGTGHTGLRARSACAPNVVSFPCVSLHTRVGDVSVPVSVCMRDHACQVASSSDITVSRYVCALY